LRKTLVLCLLAFCLASAAKKSLAVLPCIGDFDPKELERLRNKVEEVARDVLPPDGFRLIPYKNVREEIGDEALFNACKEGGVCFGDLAGKANADYGAWCMVNRYGGRLMLSFQLYSVGEKDILYTKEYDSYNPQNAEDMVEIIKKETPSAFRGKIPGAMRMSKSSSPSFEGIGDVQIRGAGYEFEGGKRYLANIASDPEGASLSFDGVPDARCAKTPCNVELGEGSVRIIAALEQYEMADTTVSIRQNNQSINMRLKANFGVLEIKPAYSDGIGAGKGWSLAINGKGQSSYENRLSPGNYEVKLSHECYEDISFRAGINKGSREVFEMARHLGLKTGGLVLSAEKDGEPVSEQVFANGRQVGETPFSGTVPVCAEIGIGSGKSKVDVKVAYKQTVRHKHKVSAPQIVAAPRAVAACGRQERVAIINTVDDRDSIGISKLVFLTDRLRETAINVLSKPCYGIMTTESIVAYLGSQERAAKECKAASCLAELGRKVSADYVAQARIGRFGENLTVKTELYSTKSGNLIGSFIGSSKDVSGLINIIDEKAPAMFKTMPGASSSRTVSPLVAGGISGLDKENPVVGGGTSGFTQQQVQKKLNALNSKAISVYKDGRGTVISISDILFEVGKADLRQELKENLAEIAAILKNLLTESNITVEGHTDNVGSADYNQKLSKVRAEAVMQYLVYRGVDEKRLKSIGYGLTKPIADNSTKEGQAKNRRVEIVIKDR
jgi:outer membrane protein OmpA-like peptidoglycan-associated protein